MSADLGRDDESQYETSHVYDGIRENDYPLPRWWLMTFAISVVFAIGYWIARHSLPASVGIFEVYADDKAEHDRVASAANIDVAAIEKMAGDPAAVAAGKALYQSRCEACHAPKGEGKTGPNLTDRFWLHGGDTKSIYMTISGGYPKLGMPEWRNVLEDRQVEELVAYVLTLRNLDVPGKGPQGDEYVPTSAPTPEPAPTPAPTP